ncbi:hypothetical protein GAY28_30765 [Azospirillum brasilense]|nr:hypothetical protein [Azospirillum brasilense]
MRDIPIIFSAPMVRALLDGRKTQTRRLVPQPPAECGINYMLGEESWLPIEKRTPVRRAFEAWTGPLFQNRPAGHLCGSFDITPRFQPRDRLWVRENWQTGMTDDGPKIAYAATPDFVEIDAWDGPDEGCGPSFNYDRCPGAKWHHWLGDVLADGPWRPSIHMPRWASRLTLVVQDVKVERLQDISEEDARAEGAEPCANGWWFDRNPLLAGSDARGAFYCLWSSIHGADAWDANPWVVAPSFAVHRCNIDKLEAREVAIGCSPGTDSISEAATA